MKYIIKTLLVVTICCINAVNLAEIKDILPTGLQVAFDVPRPFYYRWKEKTGWQYEINGSLDFKRILIDGEYGWGSILRKNPSKKRTAMAENIGQYFRMGFSYNFITNSVDHNAAFLGIRYSKAFFTDYLYGQTVIEKYKIKNEKDQEEEKVSSLWGDDSKYYKAKLQTHWFEIVGGVRVKVWGWIYTGCTARYKFAKKISNNHSQNPFDIIGWGMNDEDAFGVNFYVGIRIPLQATSAAKQPTAEVITTPKQRSR